MKEKLKRKILIYCASFIVIFGACYLFVVAVGFEPNYFQWREVSRVMFAAFSLFISSAGSIFITMWLTDVWEEIDAENKKESEKEYKSESWK